MHILFSFASCVLSLSDKIHAALEMPSTESEKNFRRFAENKNNMKNDKNLNFAGFRNHSKNNNGALQVALPLL